LSNLSTYTPMTMPVHVVHGRRAGPTFFVSAAIHGDEINGVEIIRRLLQLKILDRLKGTLICAPIVNVYGFLTHSRYLPDRRDLNRSFPGSPHGSLASRLANTFVSEIVDRSQYGIDLHTGGNHRTNLPHVRANTDDADTMRLARAFGAPIVVNSNLRDSSLRAVAAERGIAMLLYEAGEALRFDEVSIRVGVRGIVHVMREIGMLRRRRQKGHEPVVARSSTWIRAQGGGIARMTAPLGTHVTEGDSLGLVADAFGANGGPIEAPATGIIIGRTSLPVVNEGDALYHIARFTDADRAATALESLPSSEGLGPADYDEAPIAEETGG